VPSVGNQTEPLEILAQRYLLLEVLGSGGTATVYRGFDQHLKVFRAIKVIDPSLPRGPRLRHRLSQEAQLMARLAHPNVVTLFELGEDERRLFLVMELIKGGSLAQRVETHGPLPPRMAVGVEQGLLAALQFAHSQDIVHRDVKPHNVLLDLDGTPRVTDFGIARLEDGALTRTGVILGTLAYMPPEQKLSARSVDGRSDLYAAGATLYCMLTGKEPHDLFAAGLDPVVAKDKLGALPPSLAAWIMRATSFHADARFPDAGAMALALAEAARDLPPDPESTPLVAPLGPGDRISSTVGPTLLGVTRSAEATELDDEPEITDGPELSEDLVTGRTLPLPPLGPTPRPRGRAQLLALFLGAFGFTLGSLLAGWLLGDLWSRESPPQEPLPAAHAELLLPEEIDFIGPLPPEPVQDVSPVRPRPRKREAPAPVPEPEPTPEPRPRAPHKRWNVLPLTDKRAPGVMATLEAEGDVSDANGVSGRPTLVLRCTRAGLSGMLSTGLEHLEIPRLEVDMPFVAVEIRTGDQTQRTMFVTSPTHPELLEFRSDRKLVERLLAEPEVHFTYTSFLGQAVTATFRPQDKNLQFELGQHCP
jgi:serine/threonine protein kinase